MTMFAKNTISHQSVPAGLLVAWWEWLLSRCTWSHATFRTL